MRRFALLIILGISACSRGSRSSDGPSPDRGRITSSSALISRMHDRYSGRWYSTLRFEQSNTFFMQSGREEKSRWVEHLSVPGRLRIDFMPLSTRSGLLILNNRVTTFDNGRRVDTRRAIQPLLTLTADVYAIPAAVTLRRIDSLGVDLDKFHEARWQRKRVYVIGARKGDLTADQFWVDADRLVLLRMIQRERRGTRTIVTDTRVGDYREIEGFPIAFEYVSLRDGKPFFKEVYEKVRVNVPIASAMFDPARWSSARPSSP